MMEIKSFSSIDESDFYSTLELWNKEMGFIYPITKKIFDQNIVNSIHLLENASFIAYMNNEIAGFIFVKEFNNPLIMDYSNFGFISLFYVSKKFRKQGVGTNLLTLAENQLKNMGKKVVHIGKDYNNFFPGIPTDFDNLTASWLQKRGYCTTRYTHDLICFNPVDDYQIKNQQYVFRFAKKEDHDTIMEFFNNNFPGRWQYEYYEHFQNETVDSYIIALDDGNVIGFCKANDQKLKIYPYSLNWYERFQNLGSIGPLGIDKNYRKKGLGYDIIAYSLAILKARGCKEIMVDWTGLLEFYQKFKFEVWKTYLYCFKQL